uniref:Uncharacterized protein n=1 Tax=Podoviridae sp. ct6BA50 TaxID=2825221 RepID=A0A8S5VGA9_9CAUD|nr:MAG TPA: hypothetical protein [Podoviridae sp. ct6BA50]
MVLMPSPPLGIAYHIMTRNTREKSKITFGQGVDNESHMRYNGHITKDVFE